MGGSVDQTSSSYVASDPGYTYFQVKLTQVSANGITATLADNDGTSSNCGPPTSGTLTCSITTADSDQLTLTVNGSGTTAGAVYWMDAAGGAVTKYLLGGTPMLGSVGAPGTQSNFYAYTSQWGYLPMNTYYEVTLSNIDTGKDAIDSTWVSLRDAQNNRTGTCGGVVSGTLTCWVTTGSTFATYLQLTVNVPVGPGPASAGSVFTVAYSNGPVAQNLGLTVDAPPVSGSVNLDTSYYSASIQPSTRYTVTLSNVSDPGLMALVYDNLAGSGNSAPCPEVVLGTRTCTWNSGATASTLYVEVSGSDTDRGATYSIGVTSGPVAQGTSGDPLWVTAGSSGFSGSVNKTSSYYQAGYLWNGNSYTVSITGATDNAIAVYVGYWGQEDVEYVLCGSPEGGTLSCSTTAADSSVYIRVDGASTAGGATYTLKVELQ
jgi:hypothetical protein